MPELPEVETIVRELREKIVKEIFTSIEINWPPSFIRLNDLDLINNQIHKVERKGKYILL